MRRRIVELVGRGGAIGQHCLGNLRFQLENDGIHDDALAFIFVHRVVAAVLAVLVDAFSPPMMF